MTTLTPETPTTGLPFGFLVRLASDTTVCDGGRTLLGASGRIVHLSPAARSMLDDEGLVAVRDAPSAELARHLLDRGLAHPTWLDAHDPAAAAPGRAAPLDPDAVAPLDPHGVAPLDDVTVVVPVRERPRQLERLLAALPPCAGTIVVDDGSADAQTTADVAHRHGARLLRHEVSRGPAAARNHGLRTATTAYVLFVDSDIVPDAGAPARLRRHFDDPAVGLAAPRVLGLPQSGAAGWVERYEQARSSLDLGPNPARVAPHAQVSYVPSATLMARRDAVGAGFDEAMDVAEDVDLVWRVARAGWEVRYDPTATVRHEHRVETSAWLRRKCFYGTGAALLADRHGDAVAPLVLSPWTLVVTGALLAQRKWSMPLAAAVVAATVGRTARALGSSDHPIRAGATLTAIGCVATLAQTAQSLTRHHWPVAVAAAAVSPRARRALAVAAVVEGLLDHRRVRPDLDPVRYVVAHRLDDLAYGTGLWLGAVRHRSVRALLPALRGLPRWITPGAAKGGRPTEREMR